MNKVRWGILGTAKIALTKVIPAMQRSPWCEIVAIASRDLSKAKAAAAELNIPNAYGSYQKLLEDDSIEAVYNPLPNNLHVPWTMNAAEAGKHVLCEKPIAHGCGRSQNADRGSQSHRRADTGSIHGANTSAVARNTQTHSIRPDRFVEIDHGLFQLLQSRPRQTFATSSSSAAAR